MSVKVNLRHLEKKTVQLTGEISAQELHLTDLDEVIHPKAPLRYNLEVERSGQTLLVQGTLNLQMDCECVRCLKPFPLSIDLPAYSVYVPLEGEDKAPVTNDMVDLTPYLREDILLSFPQHPVCSAECDRLPAFPGKPSGDSAQSQNSAWDALNKLKF